MCDFLSAVIRRDGAVFADGVNGHSELVALHPIKENEHVWPQSFWEWELPPPFEGSGLQTRGEESPPERVVKAAETLERQLRETNGAVETLPWMCVLREGYHEQLPEGCTTAILLGTAVLGILDSGRVERVCNSGRVERVSDSGSVGSVCDSGRVERVCGSGRVGRVYDSGSVGSVFGSGRVERVCNSGRVGSVCDSGRVERVCNSGRVERVFDSGSVGSVYDSGRVERVYDSGRIGSVYGSSSVGSVYDSGRIGSVYGSSTVTVYGKNLPTPQDVAVVIDRRKPNTVTCLTAMKGTQHEVRNPTG